MGLPAISVVIPAFNEEAFLPRCLASLGRQRFRDFETIVVAGGEDNTARIARDFGATVVGQDRTGIARARQEGFDIAAGEIIASTDADTTVPEDWLERIKELFDSHPDAISVAGHFQLYDGPGFVRFWIRVSLGLMPYILQVAPPLWNFGGANFAVKKDVFKELGGFNLSCAFGEDIDLCCRLGKKGRVIFDPSLVVPVSGRTFFQDRLGLKNLFNYFRLLHDKPSLQKIES